MSRLQVETNASLFRTFNISKSHQIGQWGEQTALLYLHNKNYKTLATRYRTPYGEIDLIVSNDKTIVFVEVKTRRKPHALTNALSPHQHQRAQHAAEHFLCTNPQYGLFNMRFDAIMVDHNGVVNHIENIWEISPD